MFARRLEGVLGEALADTPVVLIHGPRQSGKSTLAIHAEAAQGRTYVTLDDPEPFGLAAENPTEFLKSYPAPLTIDEVQRAPGLFLPIKAAVDRNRIPGSYLLTGSANVLMLPKLGDSLAGRIGILDLLPLAQCEIEASAGNLVDALLEPEIDPRAIKLSKSGSSLVERCVRGGFPEAVSRTGKRRHQWFSDYVRTLLERDVRDLAHIESLTQFPKLLNLLASRAGGTLNIASLSRDTGIAHTTLTRYMDLLRALFMTQHVPAWMTNLGERFTKAPKVYLTDTGLLCHLAHLDERSLEADRSLLGPVLENFVAGELIKLIGMAESRPWLMHLRTVKGKEVDFILEGRSRGLVGIEVKTTRALHTGDADGLRFLAELAGESFLRGIILYDGDTIVPFGNDIWGMPFSALWSG